MGEKNYKVLIPLQLYSSATVEVTCIMAIDCKGIFLNDSDNTGPCAVTPVLATLSVSHRRYGVGGPRQEKYGCLRLDCIEDQF